MHWNLMKYFDDWKDHQGKRFICSRLDYQARLPAFLIIRPPTESPDFVLDRWVLRNAIRHRGICNAHSTNIEFLSVFGYIIITCLSYFSYKWLRQILRDGANHYLLPTALAGFPKSKFLHSIPIFSRIQKNHNLLSFKRLIEKFI